MTENMSAYLCELNADKTKGLRSKKKFPAFLPSTAASSLASYTDENLVLNSHSELLLKKFKSQVDWTINWFLHFSPKKYKYTMKMFTLNEPFSHKIFYEYTDFFF